MQVGSFQNKTVQCAVIKLCMCLNIRGSMCLLCACARVYACVRV